ITYKTVDTCAAEFAAETPYHYGTYEDTDEVAPVTRRAVVILGSGPNRIGQGVEFDYCCVHAAFALSDAGYETVMLNCNPETESPDHGPRARPLLGATVPGRRAQRVRGAARRRRCRARRVARGRDRVARRSDAAQAVARPRGERLPRARDLTRLDRPRRGPR